MGLMHQPFISRIKQFTMDFTGFIAAGLVIVLTCHALCRLGYINEKRRALHGTSGSCSRNKENTIAFLIGFLLGVAPAPLFLIALFCARALARSHAKTEISGSSNENMAYNVYLSRNRSSSLDKYFVGKKTGAESPQSSSAGSHSPSPLSSSARRSTDISPSSNAEPVILDSPPNGNTSPKEDKVSFTVVNIQPDPLVLSAAS